MPFAHHEIATLNELKNLLRDLKYPQWDSSIDDQFLCPIMHSIMQYPVKLSSTIRPFEASAISTDWDKDPMTRRRLSSMDIQAIKKQKKIDANVSQGYSNDEDDVICVDFLLQKNIEKYLKEKAALYVKRLKEYNQGVIFLKEEEDAIKELLIAENAIKANELDFSQTITDFLALKNEEITPTFTSPFIPNHSRSQSALNSRLPVPAIAATPNAAFFAPPPASEADTNSRRTVVTGTREPTYAELYKMFQFMTRIFCFPFVCSLDLFYLQEYMNSAPRYFTGDASDIQKAIIAGVEGAYRACYPMEAGFFPDSCGEPSDLAEQQVARTTRSGGHNFLLSLALFGGLAGAESLAYIVQNSDSRLMRHFQVFADITSIALCAVFPLLVCFAESDAHEKQEAFIFESTKENCIVYDQFPYQEDCANYFLNDATSESDTLDILTYLPFFLSLFMLTGTCVEKIVPMLYRAFSALRNNRYAQLTTGNGDMRSNTTADLEAAQHPQADVLPLIGGTDIELSQINASPLADENPPTGENEGEAPHQSPRIS